MQIYREISDHIVSGIILALRQAFQEQAPSNMRTAHNIPQEEWFVSKPVYIGSVEKPEDQHFQYEYTVYVNAWRHGFSLAAAHKITIMGNVCTLANGSQQPSISTHATMIKQLPSKDMPNLLMAFSHGDGGGPIEIPCPIDITVRPFTFHHGQIILGKAAPRILRAPHI